MQHLASSPLWEYQKRAWTHTQSKYCPCTMATTRSKTHNTRNCSNPRFKSLGGNSKSANRVFYKHETEFCSPRVLPQAFFFLFKHKAHTLTPAHPDFYTFTPADLDLHTLTPADLNLHTLTPVDLHLHTLTPANLNLHILTPVRSRSSHPHIYIITPSYLQI